MTRGATAWGLAPLAPRDVGAWSGWVSEPQGCTAGESGSGGPLSLFQTPSTACEYDLNHAEPALWRGIHGLRTPSIRWSDCYHAPRDKQVLLCSDDCRRWFPDY